MLSRSQCNWWQNVGNYIRKIFKRFWWVRSFWRMGWETLKKVFSNNRYIPGVFSPEISINSSKTNRTHFIRNLVFFIFPYTFVARRTISEVFTKNSSLPFCNFFKVSTSILKKQKLFVIQDLETYQMEKVSEIL